MPHAFAPAGDGRRASAQASVVTAPARSPFDSRSAWLSTLHDASGPRDAEPHGGRAPRGGDEARWIDHYRVRRVIGAGGMGQVLLARDTRLGRLVALKLLRADVPPSQAQSLLDEARITAKLAHPNIVTIHGVGTHEGAPYLALAFVDGESLADRLLEGPLAEAEALRVCADVAAGLTAAHQVGVSHCDLKPGNVLVSRDGRVQVADFGIARVLDTRSGAAVDGAGPIVGTPAYMAPEQWTGEAPTGAVDVWALGLLLYELVAGQHAFAADDNSPAALRSRIFDPSWRPARSPNFGEETWALLRELLVRSPAERPTARQAGRRMRALLARASRLGGVDARPFPGLRPFDESQAAFFFGREREVAELLEKARTTSVLPVVGPSGVGKSSLVLAGLVPRLRERGDWTVVSLRPGAAPFVALSRALREAVAGDPRVERSPTDTGEAGQGLGVAPSWRARVTPDALAESTTQLNLVLHDLAAATRRRVLLVVDQLEEVLTHVADPADRDRALGAFAHAADAVDPDVRVVFTIRDDFLGQAAVQAHMQRVLSGLTVVQPLDEARMVDAVQLAVERAGCRWESQALPAQVVHDASRAASPMPLLQFACAGLWDARDRQRGVLTSASLHAMGGVDGIIARHADQTLAAMTDAEVAHARALLLALVAPDGTRRVLAMDALPTSVASTPAATAGSQAAQSHTTQSRTTQSHAAQSHAASLAGHPMQRRVVDRLVAARLLTLRTEDDGRGGRSQQLEIAHEAVVQSWPRLRRWLDHSVDARRAQDELHTVARLWHQRGRPQTELWDSDALASIAQRLGDAPLGNLDAAFLDASRQASRLAQRRSRRLRWAAMAGATTLAVAGVVAAAVFKEQRDQVRAQTAELVRAAADVGTRHYLLRGVSFSEPSVSDWRDEPIDIRRVQVWESAMGEATRPVRPRQDRWTSSTLEVKGRRQVLRLETRGGPLVLRIERVGCSALDVPIKQHPGFGADEADDVERHGIATLYLPTCETSRAGLVPIPGGVVMEGGAGVPARETRLPRRALSLRYVPAFSIDRHEFSNGAFRLFTRMADISGVDRPKYPSAKTIGDVATPSHPVTGVSAAAAAAACAWMGKRLPTSLEWTTAGRGTLFLADGALNPNPNRAMPWHNGGSADRVGNSHNAAGTADGWAFSSPVGAVRRDRSPYGVMDLGGNVSEWTSTRQAEPSDLTVVRGSSWEFSAGDGLAHLSTENARHPQFIMYSHGFRCAGSFHGGKR